MIVPSGSGTDRVRRAHGLRRRVVRSEEPHQVSGLGLGRQRSRPAPQVLEPAGAGRAGGPADRGEVRVQVVVGMRSGAGDELGPRRRLLDHRDVPAGEGGDRAVAAGAAREPRALQQVAGISRVEHLPRGEHARDPVTVVGGHQRVDAERAAVLVHADHGQARGDRRRDDPRTRRRPGARRRRRSCRARRSPTAPRAPAGFRPASPRRATSTLGRLVVERLLERVDGRTRRRTERRRPPPGRARRPSAPAAPHRWPRRAAPAEP